MRRGCSADSDTGSTMRSGAPSTVSEAVEPAYMPTSKPSSSAMRADIGSKTEPGWTQTLPASTLRKRMRRSVTLFIGSSLQRRQVDPAPRVVAFVAGLDELQPARRLQQGCGVRRILRDMAQEAFPG